jgi:hypothetical protein
MIDIEKLTQEMQEIANEVKALFPKDATRRDGKSYRQAIDEEAARLIKFYTTGTYSKTPHTMKSAPGKLNSELAGFRRIAKRKFSKS